MSSITAGPAHRVQSAVVEYGYPQGHLGHLSPDEEAAFKNFKALCLEKGYYKSPTEDQMTGSHDDATLLRFLRARRFIVPEAFKQFADTEEWRKANQIDQLYETIDLEHYEETRRLYPQWTGRRDRRGIPVYVFEVKHLNSKTMAAYEKSAVETVSKATSDGKTSPKLLRLFALYENLVRFTMPLCTYLTDREHPRTPITQSNNIVDISGVGLKQFWNLRTHMQDASTLATAHYPETLDRIFVIGAPGFFPTVWGWIKKWFDPITTSKIFILSNSDMKKTLESFIDPANIPKKYGGELEFEFGDQPKFDPALKDVLTWKGDFTAFPEGPLYWVNTKDNEAIEAIAVGSINGEERQEQVCSVKKTLKEPFNDTPNGHVTSVAGVTHEKYLNVPTGPTGAPSIADTETETINTDPALAVQEGELVPASRPEPVTFVTATENLTLNEKAGTISNGTSPENVDVSPQRPASRKENSGENNMSVAAPVLQ